MSRVLIVEDEPALARTYRRLLEPAGHEVLVAPTCRAALELCREASQLEQPIDVVLLDLGLPDGPGDSILPALALLQPRAGIAIVSGRLDGPTAVELLPHASVLKPLSASALLGLIEKLRPAEDGFNARCAAFAAAYRLSQRETQAMQSGALGLSGVEASQMMGCSEATYLTYWRRVRAKTGLHSQREVIAAVLRTD